jgi:hypothetical protein
MVIVATINSALGIFVNESVAAVTARSDFTLSELRGTAGKPASLYKVVPQNDMAAFASATGMLIEMASVALLSSGRPTAPATLSSAPSAASRTGGGTQSNTTSLSPPSHPPSHLPLSSSGRPYQVWSPRSSARTSFAPSTMACILPKATSCGRYFRPQSGATITVFGST